VKFKSLYLFLLGVAVSACCFSRAPSSAAPAPVSFQSSYDGNWWIKQKEEYGKASKVWYVAGLLDGRELGNQLSVFTLDSKSKEASVKCSKYLFQSYFENEKRFLNWVTVGQVMDGLDDLYKDYRNRRIAVGDAVWLVLERIGGVPQDQIERQLEFHRKGVQ